MQVSVGGEQQYCKGDVRRVYHLVDVERVQPGERGNRQDEPASPDIDPGHAAQLARLRQVEAPQEGWKRAGRCAHWIQDSSPSDWITAELRLECDMSLHPGRWAQSPKERAKVVKPARWKYPSSIHSYS